jgi:ribonuclease P protein component
MTAPAIGRISDRRTFRDLSRPAGRAASGAVGVRYVPAQPDARPPLARVGYAVNRRCGNAVARNLLRRRLRAAVAQGPHGLEPGAYLVTPRPEATQLTYSDLVAAVTTAMRVAARRAKEAV